MLIVLTFAHFSSELLLKEQMIIPAKKKVHQTLVISTQNWSILAKFAKKMKNPAKSFTDCLLAKFPPEISREISRFS